MTVATPTPFHTSVMITEYSAMERSPSQLIPPIPRNPNTSLKSPFEGCISALKIIPTATVLIRLGKKMMDRTRFFVRILEVRMTANKSPMTTFSTHVAAAYINVFLIPILREYSEKKSMKFCSPTHLKEDRSHTVILKNRDMTVGMMNNKPKMITAGAKNQAE